MNAVRRAACNALMFKSDKPRTAKDRYEEVKKLKLKGKRKCSESLSC